MIHYPGDENFNNLGPKFQRAIEIRAAIECLAYQMSQKYGSTYSNENKVILLFNKICKQLASNTDETIKAYQLYVSKFEEYYNAKDKNSCLTSLASKRALELDGIKTSTKI